jgi:alcohol dehydrogenase (NADP+)
MIQSKGYAALEKSADLTPFSFERRDPRPHDVIVDILYSGICHSDIHQVHDEWGGSIYPMVPGHEIVGRIAFVGPEVTRFKLGDLAGVGVMVDSCRVCAPCKAGKEQYCVPGFVGTYNAKDYDGVVVQGGYADNIIVDERYVHSISTQLEPSLAAVAPLLCAGITTYSPLRHWGAGPNKKVGIVGLGGLGHMGLKFAHSFGADVTLFTTSEGKEADAIRLGADHVVLSRDKDAMAKEKASFDFILDCVSADHDLNELLGLLRLDGTLCSVGLPGTPFPIHAFAILTNRRSLSGSMIGGMPETQEMLDYCGQHNITADVEIISMNKINESFERMLKQDVKYRFVIDMKTL